jgi:hypothetical protein
MTDVKITKASQSIFISTVEEVPRISDEERAELLASLEESRAEYAVGNYHVLEPGMLRKEFEAILDNPAVSDEELDALLGISSHSHAVQDTP